MGLCDCNLMMALDLLNSYGYRVLVIRWKVFLPKNIKLKIHLIRQILGIVYGSRFWHCFGGKKY